MNGYGSERNGYGSERETNGLRKSEGENLSGTKVAPLQNEIAPNSFLFLKGH